MPVDAVLDWDSAKQPEFRFKLAWLFGLMNFSPRTKMGEKGESVHQEAEESVEAPREKKAKKKRAPRLGSILQILRIEGLFKKITGLIRSSIRQFKVNQLKADIKLMLDDPADAGFACATVSIFAPLLSRSPLRQVRIEPVFREEVSVQGTAHAVIRLQPVRLIPSLLSFVFSRPAWRLFRIMAAQLS